MICFMYLWPFAARLQHGDPVLAGVAWLLVLYLTILEEGVVPDNLARELHRPQLMASMFRRRYAGCRFSWARAESHTLWAGLVWIDRNAPQSFRLAFRVMILSMVASIFVPAIGAASAFMGEVRARRPRGRAARELAATLDAVDDSKIVGRIRADRAMGRPGYHPRVLWRAYLSSFIMGLSSTNALIRRLQDDPDLRVVCGFGRTLPHRTTFNRFIQRLDRHTDLVNGCLAGITDQLAELLPGLGEKVAVDSTTVRSHSNPWRTNRAGEKSDLDAGWTAKGMGKKKQFYWGYKLHLMVDAVHEVPLFGYTTPANRGDSPELLPMLDGARKSHDWIRPRYVMADKGYDALSNYNGVKQRGGRFIAPTRRHQSVSAEEEAAERKREERDILENPPTCIGFVDMVHVRTDPARGILFRCRSEGCNARRLYPASRLACRMEVWETPMERRRPGSIYEGSVRWNQMYLLRQSAERVFKSLKESRRLERHCVRGLARMSLHVTMSVLGFSATYLVNLLADAVRPRWMVRKVA